MVKQHGSMTTGALCAALFLVACNTDMQGEGTFEPVGDRTTFRGTSHVLALEDAALKEYASDRQYVRSLMPRGVSVPLNHADPRQHRFAVTRMKLAGKTPENSPELFRQMTALKLAHQAKGFALGATAPSLTEPDGRVSQHETLTTGVSTTQATVVSGALASRQEQLVYGYVDSCIWDKNGNPLGECEYTEVYGNMPYHNAQAVGDLSLATTDEVEGDSMLYTTVAATGEVVQSYAIAQPQVITAANSLTGAAVVHPRDSTGDGVTQICLERNNGGCDYHNMGMWTLKVPLQGQISVTGPGMIIDWPTIVNQYRAGGPSPGNIYVTLGNNGGGCRLPATGQAMSMKTFWQNVTAEPEVNPTTLKWDMATNNNNWASFSNSCQLVQATVYLTMNLVVPYENLITGKKDVLPVTITNAPQPRPLTPPNLQFNPALRITNSCLAAGTEISIGGSATRKIEELGVGDKVFSPYATSLTITDTTIGTERGQMVRIRDERGRELLMTEMHPLHVVARGMVPAKLLRAGDLVKTSDGSSKLVAVTRESYAGQVHNLKVGSATEARSLGTDQTAIYANGFLVGDSQIQSNYELAEIQAQTAAPKRLPSRLRTDYQTSLNRADRR